MINGIIYKATNKVNGKVYIGQTVKNLHSRRLEHITRSNNPNSPSGYFMKALNKYSADGFDWEVIDESDNKKELNIKEIYWIDYYNSFGTGGYNLTIGGGGVVGVKRSEESNKESSKRMYAAWENGHSEHMPRGNSHPNSKFTEEDVLKIKSLILEKQMSSKELAEMFSVSTGAISDIRRGRNWRHIVSPEEVEEMKRIMKETEKITYEEAIQIKNHLIAGDIKLVQIAEKYNIAINYINAIRRGDKWSGIFTKEEAEKINNIRIYKRLSEQDKIEIKALIDEGNYFLREIAEEYGVHITTISRMNTGKRNAIKE